jgi:hypothetical protein
MTTSVVKITVNAYIWSTACKYNEPAAAKSAKRGYVLAHTDKKKEIQRRTNIIQERLDAEGHPQHYQAQDGLHGDNPRTSASDGGEEPRVDDRGPEKLESVWVATQRKYGDF